MAIRDTGYGIRGYAEEIADGGETRLNGAVSPAHYRPLSTASGYAARAAGGESRFD
ncbi:hypothetical protein GGER_16700 [Serratia rubidaea]